MRQFRLFLAFSSVGVATALGLFMRDRVGAILWLAAASAQGILLIAERAINDLDSRK